MPAGQEVQKNEKPEKPAPKKKPKSGALQQDSADPLSSTVSLAFAAAVSGVGVNSQATQSRTSSSKGGKEVNKTDQVTTEAAQLLQQLDDVGSLGQVTEQKINGILSKLAARLTPDLVNSCVQDDEKGIRTVALAREMKLKLTACIPLATSLAASSGDAFHPEYLKSCMANVRSLGVTVSVALDEILAVREVSVLGECLELGKLVEKLQSGLSHLSQETQKEISCRAIVHAVESLMRPALPSVDSTQEPDKIRNAALARCHKLRGFVKDVMKSDLMKLDFLKDTLQDLQHVEALCTFIETPSSSVVAEGVSEAEKARTMLSNKNCTLLKCITAFPLGVWIMDATQNGLAAYHSSATLKLGLAAASPSNIEKYILQKGYEGYEYFFYI